MYHTWISLFFWIVLCCPVAVTAEDGSSETAEQNENAAFRECVLKETKWKTECSKYLKNSLTINNPYPPQAGVSDSLVPERGGVWGQTPAEMYRKLYFPDPDRQIRG